MGRRSLAAGMALAVGLVAACGASPPVEWSAVVASDPSPGCRRGTLAAADGERGEVEGREYLLDAPAAPADRPLPLVLAFHGFRGDPDDMRRGTGLSDAARGATVVAYPAGHEGVRLLGTVGRGWDLRPEQTTDRDFVRRLLDHVEAHRCIDRRRVYATGMSNGGFVASLLGCQLADRFAAVAAVAGGQALGDCAPLRPVPVLFLYGGADGVVPLEMVREGAGWWAWRNGCTPVPAREAGCARWRGCSADVAACEGPDGHRWPADATARIRVFFRTHARP